MYLVKSIVCFSLTAKTIKSATCVLKAGHNCHNNFTENGQLCANCVPTDILQTEFVRCLLVSVKLGWKFFLKFSEKILVVFESKRNKNEHFRAIFKMATFFLGDAAQYMCIEDVSSDIV